MLFNSHVFIFLFLPATITGFFALGRYTGEFLDEHHAFPECYQRVFARYWRDSAAGRAGPGFYRP